MICKNCIHKEVCKCKSKTVYECEHFKDGIIKNQYDRIRNMSIEEMAEFLNDNYKCEQCDYHHKCCNGECIEGIKEYLESEVEGE